MGTREASHSGSWYSDDGPTLSRQLDRWLDQVPDSIDSVGEIPQPSSRVIIAPHAGYSYSGPCAAYAYKALDLSKAKRIFLLGPSHHHALSTLALPTLESYATPLSSEPLPLDTDLISHLLTLSTNAGRASTSSFTTMSRSIDETEHSLEMHLPYIHKMLQRQHPNLKPSQYPPLIPIMVGSTSDSTERAFGALLAPYVADEENAFVISSDFCHWGSRFGYTYYCPSIPESMPDPESVTPILPPNGLDQETLGPILAAQTLSHRDKSPKSPAIHESIAAVDLACMAAVHEGTHAGFADIVRKTGNTVCGRHPIGVMMAAIESLNEKAKKEERKGVFTFLRYERSSDVVSVRDSSVSYVSAFAVI